MIVFISPFPALSDEKDGMIQRVVSIDSLVADQPRVYLEISFRRFFFKRVHNFGNATVFQLNFFFHFTIILSWLRKASVVYIHSVYNSLKVLPAYWIAKPITDLHGVVPEEEQYRGNLARGYLYGFAERIALCRSATVIYVTLAMKQHFYRKYKRQASSDRVLAIIPNFSDVRAARNNVLSANRESQSVIYAGGVQVWQNIPMMVDTAEDAPQFRYTFLSNDPQVIQRMTKPSSTLELRFLSVRPNQVPDYYLSCTFGFILRNPVIVNMVSCPTKLVEYLFWGVIPIVLSPDIGDFNELGFSYVTLEDFTSGNIPSNQKVTLMRVTNRQVIERLIDSQAGELERLRAILCS